jgi:hypothetical protein
MLSLLTALAAAGCFAPDLPDCAIACGTGMACPSGLTCGTDGLCRKNPAAACGTPPDAGAHDAPADAPTADPDAPVAEPDAPIAQPDAPIAQPDAAAGDPDAPPGPPDALPPAPDAPTGPPDAGPPPCTAEVSTVDRFATGEAVVLDTQLAIARDGHLHVSFVTRLDEHFLFHADRAPDANGWRAEAVAFTWDYLVGQHIDDVGAVRVSFVGSDHVIQLARRDGFGAWRVEPADDHFGWNSSTAVDGHGAEHVLIHTPNAFVHARRGITGLWLSDPIDLSGQSPGLQSSFAVAPDGTLVVAYLVGHQIGEPDELRLARRSELGADGWQVETLEKNGDPGHYPAMVIDEVGGLHIVHGDYAASALRYLHVDADGFRRDLVVFDDDSALGRYSGIAIDRGGNVHITSHDSASGLLRHGVLKPGARAFAMRTVEDVGAIAGRSSIAVAPDGRVLVSFPNARTGHARVARLCVD